MRRHHVMVIGSERECSRVVFALRDRGLQAWSDRLGRVALDFVSFDWADALVIVDNSTHLECEHLRPVLEFPGPKLVATSSPVPPERRAELLNRGFDAVLAWPSSTDLIAAYVDRFLCRAALTPSERVHV